MRSEIGSESIKIGLENSQSFQQVKWGNRYNINFGYELTFFG